MFIYLFLCCFFLLLLRFVCDLLLSDYFVYRLWNVTGSYFNIWPHFRSPSAQKLATSNNNCAMITNFSRSCQRFCFRVVNCLFDTLLCLQFYSIEKFGSTCYCRLWFTIFVQKPLEGLWSEAIYIVHLSHIHTHFHFVEVN